MSPPSPPSEPELRREVADAPGRDNALGSGASPGGRGAQKLLADELALAVQRRRGAVNGGPAPGGFAPGAAVATPSVQRVMVRAPTNPIQVQRSGGKAATTGAERDLQDVVAELDSLLGGSSGFGLGGLGVSSFAKIREAVVAYTRAVRRGEKAAKRDQLLARIDDLATQWVNSHRGEPDQERRGVVAELIDRVAQERRSGTQNAAIDRYMADLTSGVKLFGEDTARAESATPMRAATNAAKADAAQRADRAKFLDERITQASVLAPSDEGIREFLATEEAERLGVTPAEQAAIRAYTQGDYHYINPGTANSRSWMKVKMADDTVGKLVAKPKDGTFEDTAGSRWKRQLPTSGEDRWINNLMQEGGLHAAVATRGLAKLPPYTKAHYRGETVAADGVPKKGKTFKTTNLTSTTFVLSSAMGFMATNLKQDRPIGIVWVYTGGGGCDVHALSAFQGEGEVLVPTGAEYRIASVRQVRPKSTPPTGEEAAAFSSLQAQLKAGSLSQAQKVFVVRAEYTGGGVHPATSAQDAAAPTTADADETAAQLRFLARAKARQLINAAKEVEPKVTSDLKGLAKSRGGHLVGLEYRFKTEESLARKLEDRARTTVSSAGPKKAVNAEAAKVNDSLRYTMIMPSAKYKALADGVGQEMKALGYQPGNAWDAWASSRTYKGHNLTFTATADDGTTKVLFELQLHTKDSFGTKQKIHGMYEEARAATTTPTRRAELDTAMAEQWKEVKVPAGLYSLK
ncbi:MAG TPA: ADP-ribosyltransferase [Solirubrobacteraceae bacterium]|nr:ADP-ribosyltransferase [Solirubrobacteraceae bacterium]